MVQQTLNGAATTPRGEVARHKVVWRERQESLPDVQALRVKLQDGDTELGARRYKSSKCLCRDDVHKSTLVRVLFQVFLAFCHSMLL